MSINKNISSKYIYFICIICVVIIIILWLIFQQQNEGFTPKIMSMYNSNLRKVRKHLETNVFETSFYKRGAVPFLRYFSIW